MRGAQSPESSRSRIRERRVYVLRRVLAILAVLLLLVLIVPRACQAIVGSGEDAGSGGDQGAKAPEKAAGAGAADGGEAGAADGGEDATAENSGAKDGDETDKKSGAGGDEAREDKDTGDDANEKDLGEVLTETVAARAAEPGGTDQDNAVGNDASADGIAPPPEGSGADGSQPVPAGEFASTNQQPAPVAQRAPVDRRSTGSSDQRVPVDRGSTGSSDTSTRADAEKPRPRAVAAKPVPERPRAPALKPNPKPNPAPVEVSAPEPEPEPIDVVSAPAAPVATAPVQPAPFDHTGFAGSPPVGPNFGGGAVGATVNHAAAFAGGVRGVSAGVPARAFP